MCGVHLCRSKWQGRLFRLTGVQWRSAGRGHNTNSMTFPEALRLLESFERHGVAYVLVGSMAMAAQGLVRATRDIVWRPPDTTYACSVAY